MKVRFPFLTLLVAALVLAAGPIRVSASRQPVVSGMRITVNTTVDDVEANGNCTLREAVIAANTDRAVDRCPAGRGADTIILQSKTYQLSIPGKNEDEARSGDLDILCCGYAKPEFYRFQQSDDPQFSDR